MADSQGTAQTRAKNKYNAKAYDRIALQVKKGRRDILKAHAESQGESLNGFINRAIDETIERDRSKDKTTPEKIPVWSVAAVEPHADYTLTVTFRSGEKRLYDMRPLIEDEKWSKVYAPLKDIEFFMSVYVEISATWSDTIDIAPEELYYNGVPIDETIERDKALNE